MSEMQKKLGVTDFVSEIKHVENYPDFEKLALAIQHGLQGFIGGSNIGLAGCGMRVKNGGGIRDGRNFNSWMRDENRMAGPGYALFRKRDRG